MADALPSFVISRVPIHELEAAFKFHRDFASANSHIWPRSPEEFKQLAREGSLFGVRIAASGEYVGLCYSDLKEADRVWEVGGLMVASEARKRGIGTLLARFVLVHTFAWSRPFRNSQEVIAMVHEANQDPRQIVEDLGFVFVKSEEVPEEIIPKSMKRNPEGKLVGHRFRFTDDGLRELERWSRETLDLDLETAQARLDLGAATLDELKDALTESLDDIEGK
ncbi:MAG TPA: GNAT family N-acetyltransferase [Terriglobales bacterium]|jgi:RimJ/RimL family protein N-acetyltransferase|nr:GNAT family N-acetyltransferase [Terriglobales bacterium]